VVSFSKILWPTDFSDASRKALPMVNSLAEQFSATVDVLHVLSPAPPMASMSGHAALTITEYNNSLEEWARTNVKELIDQEISTEITATPTILMGAAAHEIIRFAEVNDIDLIVIASHGETGLSRLIFGSVAEKVVRLASCPVLTMPAAPEEEEE